MNSIARLLTLMLASMLGALGAERDPRVVAVERVGGVVKEHSGGVSVEFHLGARKLTDEGLATITPLGERVVSLNLRDTQITSAGLTHLKELRNLRRLHLERTAVGDAGIAHLAGLTRLEYLNLYSTKVTDKALPHLGGMKKLQQLYVWQTGVTAAGRVRLQRALPKLKIVGGVDLDKVAATVKEKPPAEPLVDLKWNPISVDDPPNSKTGTFTTVTFENKRKSPVKLFWVQYGGGLKFYADIAAGAVLERNTFSDATWVITDENESPLGYFRSTLKKSRAVIPE